MQDNTTTENERQPQELADKLLKELADGRVNLCIMMGVREFYLIEPQPEDDFLAGVAFRYSQKLVKNKSNVVRIFALPNGKRRMEWCKLGNGSMQTVDSATDIEPESMEKVWWKHTACAVRTPWILEAFRKEKFPLGKVLMTPGVKHEFSQDEMMKCLNRHHTGDWGDVCKEDQGVNEQALKDGSRLLSVYKFENGRVLWIITEAVGYDGKRAATTLLLPDEY